MKKLERHQARTRMEGGRPEFGVRGFTITEMLVCIGVIGLIAAMTLPAVQQSRAASRRMQCLSNLKQLGIASHSFASTHGFLHGYETLSMLQALPDLGYQDHAAIAGGNVKISVLLCPDDTPRSDELGWGAVTNYLFNGGSCFNCYNGIHPNWFPGNSPSRIADITDGTSQTALFAERLFESTPGDTADCATHPELCVWNLRSTYDNGQEDRFFADCHNATERTSPIPMRVNVGRNVRHILPAYSHVMPPNSMSCYWSARHARDTALPAKSHHWGGVNVVFCDGHVRFISNHIDVRVWRALGTRNGNDSTGEF